MILSNLFPYLSRDLAEDYCNFAAVLSCNFKYIILVMVRRYKGLKIAIGVIVVGWIVCYGGCNLVMSTLSYREYYDPYTIDESSCRELIKVENCLNSFFNDYNYSESLEEYVYYNFLPDDTNIRATINNAQKFINYGSNNSYYENRYGMTYSEAMQVYCICSAYELWYSTLRERLESYLYSKCESKLINNYRNFSHPNPAGIANEEETNKRVKLMIDDYFAMLNTPSFDYYELLNDDNASYQVWLICKESDADVDSGTRITVTFENDKRSLMRLFRPKVK